MKDISLSQVLEAVREYYLQDCQEASVELAIRLVYEYISKSKDGLSYDKYFTR